MSADSSDVSEIVERICAVYQKRIHELETELAQLRNGKIKELEAEIASMREEQSWADIERAARDE